MNLNSIALLDIDTKLSQPIAALINSPRSLEAFRRTGIKPEELEPLDLIKLNEKIAQKNPSRIVNKDVFNLRVVYANKARQKKLQQLREVRETIIYEGMGGQSPAFSIGRFNINS